MQEIVISGVKVEYTEKRASDGPLLVFMHGWGSNFQLFEPLLKHVDNYIAFNFPGMTSPLPEPWALADYAQFTHAFLEKKCSDDALIFVVHSFGGRVLLKMLNEYDYSRTKYIICTGVPFIRTKIKNHSTIQSITKIAKIVSAVFPKSMSEKLRTSWYKKIGASDYDALKSDVMKKTFQNIIEEDISKLTEVLREYKTAFIWGDCDEDAPRTQAEIIAAKTNTPLHIIEGAGHFAFMEPHDVAFLKILKETIQK